ncbi:TorF family putative porin [Aquisalimonas asiatica]|uniref:Porin n=1 Tax=Aquisalimonas asiatica TaxID=406100 RepID=A0A1H8S4U1_9GAMM|nr:TorF family putative porin [Aquisalimonas asiatica]SEO73655.1 conserved hypothetical protein [Aquisalimonas asiatica]
MIQKNQNAITNCTAAALFLGFSGVASAQGEFSVGVFSDYIDNGESRSGNNAVVQGAFEHSHHTGFFAGTAISNLSNDSGDEFHGHEIVPFVGYGFAAGPVDLELAYEYIATPDVSGATYEGEAILGASVGPVSAEVGYITNAHDRDAEGSVVYAIGAGHEFMPGVSVDGAVGYDDPDDESGTAFWELGMSREMDQGTISLTYASRDESDAQNLFVAGFSTSF